MLQGSRSTTGQGWLFVCVLAVLIGNVKVLARQIDPRSTQTQDIVLLKNGHSLTGTAQFSVDRTIVTTKSGSRLVLQTDEVLVVCRSWQEAWEFKRDVADVNSRDSLQELFEWCIKNRLYDEADEVVTRLSNGKFGGTNPASLRTRLEYARNAENRSAAYERMRQEQLASRASTENTGGELIPRGDDSVAVAGQPILQGKLVDSAIEDKGVEMASFAQPLPTRSLSPVVDATSLELFVKAVGSERLQTFRRDIEPALLAGCTNAGCHAPTAPHLALTTIGAGMSVPARMSQQNFFRTMQFLLHNENAGQRMITAAALPHGGLTFETGKGLDQEQLAILASWIKDSIKDIDPAVVPTLKEKGPIVPTIAQPGLNRTSIAPAAFHAPPRAGEPKISEVKPIPRNSPLAPSIPDLNATPRNVVAATDEFDPELFNRFFLEKQVQADNRREMESLGFPDIQSLIGNRKSPEK